ncbi:transposase [Nitrospinae bacterium AH_259_B05_G02_I21]|nr:transposase [Nitrospinae bacterium AH_259_B05_G02_I21]MDA2931691.1 transposase [Nitrospinae bacterium AH-259-F20]
MIKPATTFIPRATILLYPLINDEDYACMYCPDRGLAKVNLQCLFTVLVVNIKRWFNLIRARALAHAQVHQ